MPTPMPTMPGVKTNHTPQDVLAELQDQLKVLSGKAGAKNLLPAYRPDPREAAALQEYITSGKLPPQGTLAYRFIADALQGTEWQGRPDLFATTAITPPTAPTRPNSQAGAQQSEANGSPTLGGKPAAAGGATGALVNGFFGNGAQVTTGNGNTAPGKVASGPSRGPDSGYGSAGGAPGTSSIAQGAAAAAQAGAAAAYRPPTPGPGGAGAAAAAAALPATLPPATAAPSNSAVPAAPPTGGGQTSMPQTPNTGSGLNPAYASALVSDFQGGRVPSMLQGLGYDPTRLGAVGQFLAKLMAPGAEAITQLAPFQNGGNGQSMDATQIAPMYGDFAKSFMTAGANPYGMVRGMANSVSGNKSWQDLVSNTTNEDDQFKLLSFLSQAKDYGLNGLVSQSHSDQANRAQAGYGMAQVNALRDGKPAPNNVLAWLMQQPPEVQKIFGLGQ